jgi:hypothetical protein
MLELLEEMKRSIIGEPTGALTLGRRHRLWKEVMERRPIDFQWRLAAIGYLVCRDTVSAWNASPFEPTDHRLYQQFRVLCQQVLLGELEGADAWNRYMDLDAHSRAIRVADDWSPFIALSAVRVSCADAIQPPQLSQSINIELADADIDPDELDAHFLTSCVVAGGTTWDPLSSKSKRQAFWLDWLDKLFPLTFSERETLLALIHNEEE